MMTRTSLLKEAERKVALLGCMICVRATLIQPDTDCSRIKMTHTDTVRYRLQQGQDEPHRYRYKLQQDQNEPHRYSQIPTAARSRRTTLSQIQTTARSKRTTLLISDTDCSKVKTNHTDTLRYRLQQGQDEPHLVRYRVQQGQNEPHCYTQIQTVARSRQKAPKQDEEYGHRRSMCFRLMPPVFHLDTVCTVDTGDVDLFLRIVPRR